MAVLVLPLASARAQSVRECSPEDAAQRVAALESLGSPCRYYLTLTELTVDRTEPIGQTPEVARLIQLARAGADGSGSSALRGARQDVDALIERYETFASVRSSLRSFDALETSTPDVQVEEIVSPRPWGPRGTLRGPSFNLLLSLYEPGVGHQLHAVPANRANIVYDMQQLLAPLVLDAESLANLRQYRWIQEPARGESVDAFLAQPRLEARDALRLEYSRASGMPVAASYHPLDPASEFRMMGMFEYGPSAEQGGSSWLCGGLTIIVQPDSVQFTEWVVSGAAFDIRPQDLRLHVTGTTRLFEDRTLVKSFNPDRSTWPPELLGSVVVDDERYSVLLDPAEVALAAKRAPPREDPRWIGFALLAAAATVLGWRWVSLRRQHHAPAH